MIAHVRRVTDGPLKVWWWFFTTDPHLFSVYYRPTDEERRNEAVLIDRFFEEQLAKVRAYIREHPDVIAGLP